MVVKKYNIIVNTQPFCFDSCIIIRAVFSLILFVIISLLCVHYMLGSV